MERSAILHTPAFTIGEAARVLKVSIPTMRMYERERLIIPHRKASGQRLYSQNDITRLACIRRAINEMKISIAGIRMMYAMIPCWSIKGCSNRDRQNCTAYSGTDRPCWAYRHEGNACEGAACRECQVYQNHSECHTIKESIKEMTSEQ